MKTGKFLLLSVTTIMLSAVSCQKAEAPVAEPNKELVNVTFSSLTTKTTLDESHKVLWKSTDHIGVFSEGQIYDFMTEQDGDRAVFTGLIVPTGTYYSVYPYDADATISEGVISTEIPVNQVAVKGGFADGANVTVAKTSDTVLEFKNVCGLLQFEITREDISSVTFESANGEKVAGAVDITVSETPSWSAPSGSTSVTLSAEEGTLEPGVYYMTVLPQTYDGFTLTFTNDDGMTTSKVSEAVLEIERADGKNLQVADADIEFTATYEIDLTELAFTGSNIYEAKDENNNVVAIICKEFLKTSNQQAVVVYGIKPGSGIPRIMDSSNPVGLVARVLKQGEASQYQTYTDVSAEKQVHGGVYSFKSDVMAYVTTGTKAALNTVYATYDAATGISVISDTYEAEGLPTTLQPRTLILSDRGDTKAYRLAKIGRQIWMIDNLATSKLKGGTSLTEYTVATDLYPNPGSAAFYKVNDESYAYNGNAALSSKLPSSGWKVPTKSDAQTLKGYAGDVSYTLNSLQNNITGFSNQYDYRVTQNGVVENDPIYWCSDDPTNNKLQCIVLRKSGAAPGLTTQSYVFGYWVRLMRGLY